MSRLAARLGNLSRRIARWCGAPEIRPERIEEFLNEWGRAPLPEWTAPSSLAMVIPCYGHAPYLSDALASIACQERLPDEVIAVDDASPDETPQLLERHLAPLRERGVACTILTNGSNQGQAASLNRGIEVVVSDLIMILNDDDYLMHDAVALALEVFRSTPGLAMLGGASVHFSDGQLAGLPKNARAAGSGPLHLDLRIPERVREYRCYNDLNMTHSGCCFLKTAWDSTGGYRTVKGERLVPFSDRDFQLRVNALFPVAVTDLPLSLWRSGSSVDQGLDS